jgi:tetratricopeptide (TPR) repeat protein
LGETYRKAGRPDRALPFALDGFKLAEATLGLHHSDTHWAMTNLADVYFAVSRPDDAFRLHEECVDRTAADLGADDAQTIASRQMLAAKYASHGRLADAASEYARLFHNKPDDHGIALRAALLNGATGDWGNYDAVCRQMLDRFANTDSGWAANRTSLACLLSSPPVGDTKRLVRLADFAVATCDENGAPADQVNSRRTRGLASYRTGDFQGALKWCQQSRNLEAARAESSSYLATILVIEAMAWYRNGNPAEARAAFDESDRIICQRFPGAPANVGADWFNWLMHDLLRREAVELLGLQDAADAIRARSDRHAPTDAADSSPTRSVEMDN